MHFLFPFLALVSEVHMSPDVLLEHSVPSASLVPSDSFSLSSDNVAKALQRASSATNPAAVEEQVKPQLTGALGVFSVFALQM